MAVLDLSKGQMCQLPEADTHIETSAALPADLQAPQVIAIQFGVFSDGRGFTHAAIKPADHPHWQQAHQAIRHHFQHMPDSPRSRRD